MPAERPARPRSPTSPRLRIARAALLSPAANALLDHVRGAICEPTRAQIVRVLSAAPLSVGELAITLERSKSATSQHLRVLRDSGVVVANRRGRSVTYNLVRAPMVDAAVQVISRAAGDVAA